MNQISTGLNIYTHATIDVPNDIGRKLLGILQHLPGPELEYGIYLKGTWDAKTATVHVQPGEYYIPAQEVTAASINFTEEPPGLEWNVVAHRHPNGCRTFSATDRNSINEEFLASFLFIPPWSFPDAIVNIPIAPGSKMQVKAAVTIDGSIVDFPAEQAARVRANVKALKIEKPKDVGNVQKRPGGSIPSVRPRSPVGVGSGILRTPNGGSSLPIYRSGPAAQFSGLHPEDVDDAAFAALYGHMPDVSMMNSDDDLFTFIDSRFK